MDEMTLNELHTGEQGKIMRVEGEGALRRRLMDMGLTPGTIVYVRKVAPLGDPVELHLRGYELTLRKEDASNISVVKLADEAHNKQATHAGHSRRFWGGRR
jgi:Fe2+ transport system protein FeoA